MISNEFDKYSVNVGATYAKSIPKSNKSPISYINQNSMDTFYTIPTTNRAVEMIIANFKDSAPGWDNLKPCVIRKIRRCFVTPLVYICNLLFTKGVFPNELKLAKVVLTFKQGNRELFQNYHPFSMFPCISKVRWFDLWSIDFISR